MIEVEWEAAAEALAAMAARVPRAAEMAVTDVAHEAERRIKVKLTTYSHPKGTPTPSPPGGPPALVTGSLRRSVIVKTMSAGLSPAAEVGPTMIYSRAQELGDERGLPPRPYVAPAGREMNASGATLQAQIRGFSRGMGWG